MSDDDGQIPLIRRWGGRQQWDIDAWRQRTSALLDQASDSLSNATPARMYYRDLDAPARRDREVVDQWNEEPDWWTNEAQMAAASRIASAPTLFQRCCSRIRPPTAVPVLLWLYPISLFIGQLFLAPYLSMERHMAVLELKYPIIPDAWWLFATSGPIQEEYRRRQSQHDLESWIDREREIAWGYLLRNIGPIAGAADGLIIASPSRAETLFEPDYYSTWTRDAALTMSTVMSTFVPECYAQPWLATDTAACVQDGDILIEPLVRAYVAGQAHVQVTVNPSGALWTGGLNEPKFHVDGSRFDDEWGRPQRDGPALRALALIPYANYLLDRAWPADFEYVRDHLYDPHALRKEGSVIKNDLEEVGGGWWLSSFDLWEEVNGHHLFTLLACQRALQAGARLATRLDDAKAAEYYLAQSALLDNILPAFWNDTGYWQSTAHIDDLDDLGVAPAHDQRAWLDCSLPLSIIHAGSEESFAATDSETLASLRAYIMSFDSLYPINSRSAKPPTLLSLFKSQQSNNDWTQGWVVGRYAEDVYNGIGTGRGNPWHICTYSVAHVLYLAKEGFERQGYIPLNNLTRPLWADMLQSRYRSGDEIWVAADTKGLFTTALKALSDVADRYMKVGRQYAPYGRMSEQIDRNDGTPVGARDLTWSYASFLEAARARDRARD